MAGPTGPTGPGALSGTLDYIVKFTPDGQSGGDSRIYDDGTFVGIGTAVPFEALDISQNYPFIFLHGTGSDNMGLSFGTTQEDGWMYRDESGYSGAPLGSFVFSNEFTASRPDLIIEPTDGLVGIGVNTPTSRLHVVSSTTETEPTLLAEYNGTANDIGAVHGVNNSATNTNRNYGLYGTYNSSSVYGIGVVGYGYAGWAVPNLNIDAGIYASAGGTATDGEGRGVWATSGFGGTAVYAEYIGGGSGYAAKLLGNVQIVDGTEDVGRVLTSDASGNATWQDIPNQNPSIGFSAQHNLGGSIGGVVGDTVVFDTELYDDGAGYDPVTGIYTVPSTGTYHFDANVLFDIANTAGNVNVWLVINGSASNASTASVSTTDYYNGHLSVDIQLSAGDTVHVFVNDNAGGNDLYNGNSLFSHFTGHKIY